MRRSRVLVLLVALTVAGCDGDADDDTNDALQADDAVANERILSEVAVFPKAEAVETTVNPYFHEGETEPVGHTTNVTYEVPDGTQAETIMRFYTSELRDGWRCRGEEVLLSCKRGSSVVGLNLDNLGATRPSFELVVDHDDRTADDDLS